MFKSIQWKIISLFLLLTISVMIVVGTFLLNSLNAYFHKDFNTLMSEKVFVPQFIKQLDDFAVSDNIAAIQKILEIYSGRLGINSFRNVYLLEGQTARVLYGSDGEAQGYKTVTPNILTAMSGKVGGSINQNARYMDYAVPLAVGDTAKYIVYVIDTKDELYAIMQSIFINILWALLFGLIISAFLGFFFSRTIISPISALQSKAERLASGDFEQKIDVHSDDEIGRLTMSFNLMASDLKKTLGEIASEKTKIEAILSNMTDGVIAFNLDGEIIHINPAAENMLGLTDKNCGFDELFEKLGVKISMKDLLYLEHNQAIERYVPLDDKHLKAFFAPFNTDSDPWGGIVVVFQDITKQQKLDNARREFVANVSHELRTPLTTIKSYAETLLENTTAKEDSIEVQFLTVINDEADRMARIVKDLLTLSRLDYNKGELVKTNFLLDVLVRDVIRKLEINAKNHNQTITFAKENEIPMFYGDRDRIEQVITNILSNAIKYTHDGGKIDVSCGYMGTDAFIRVKDNGIGIPEEDIPRLFERFYRVDKARSRESGGTGLGLAIAKEIVDLHGGKINIESTLGKGTTVIVTMPIFSK